MKLRMTTAIGLVAVMFAFTACDKDDDDNVQASIQHKWSVNNIIYNVESTMLDTTIIYVGTDADYFDFRADGKVYSHMEGAADTTDYEVINNEHLVVEGDTFDISVLTNTQFQFRNIDSSGSDSFETIANLTR